ncbi:VC0807 family protein [Lichenicoccus roseus]|nr:VC0807 family protein [Lichenicoccus roseus]
MTEFDWSKRMRQAPGLVLEMMANFVLPYLIYLEAAPKTGEVEALLLSSLPPILWSLVEFARSRRIDALSILVVAGIVLSLLAFVGGGSVRMLQLRENLVTGLIALLFLGSAAIGRPLMVQLALATARRRSEAEAALLEQASDHQRFRRTMTLMTVVWGAGLMAQTILACVLVFTMPVANYLIVSPIVGYGCMGALGLWTLLFARRARRRAGEAIPMPPPADRV